jgi:hypothetical protein
VAVAQNGLGDMKLIKVQFGIIGFGVVCTVEVVIRSWLERTGAAFSLMGVSEYGILISAGRSPGFAVIFGI